MTRVLVLGGSGMLGSMVARVLATEHDDLDVAVAQRAGFDALQDEPGDMLDDFEPNYVVNAIGVLASRIDADDEGSVERAMEVNGRFPRRLAEAAQARNVHVIHATTDGVFSGLGGPYDEASPHDAVDVYGASKSLGEVAAEHVVNLRCSIVGPEPGRARRSLLEWVLEQPHGARLTGYVDQFWNGVTTLHFARLCAGFIRSDDPPSGTIHVVPADVVTKAALLSIIARAHGRDDLTIEPGPSTAPSDRTLATLDPARNLALWCAAGYDRPPTIGEMVTELARVRL